MPDASSLADPYRLTKEGIKEPPVGWRASLRYFGPGLIVSASIVGSGELIATTAAGAEAGFALLWLVIIGTSVKVAVQIELARWTIATGQPALTGYNRVPPRFGRVGWVNALWIVLSLSKILQVGGIVGGTAMALSILLPIGDPGTRMPVTIWTIILVAGSIAMLISNRYRLVERGAFVLVVVFSLLTIVIALGLPFTPFAYDLGDLGGGLVFALPAGTIGAALAMFGITGVGADEITFYTYWCVEKGYARWAGPPDGSPEWERRANGWIKVMYKDAFVSWVIYTFGTLAFFIMGATVLHPRDLVPEGDKEMLETLSRMYTDALGDWASIGFLVGAVAVLGSTLWASIPSWSRMYVNLLACLGVFDWNDGVARNRWIRGFIVALPIIWGTAYLLIKSPVLMVQVGGVATGVFLLAVVVAVWWLRNNEVPRALHGGRLFNAVLVISSAAIALLGLYTIFNIVVGGG